MSECTFNPMINHEYEYSAARDEDFYVGVPKGFRVIYCQRLNLTQNVFFKVKGFSL